MDIRHLTCARNRASEVFRLWKLAYILSGCIGIIKSSQQLTLNHSVFLARFNSQQSTIIPVQPELILLIATFYFDNSTLSSFTTRRLRGIDFSRGSKSNTFRKASSTCSNGICPFSLKTTFPDWSRMTV